MNGTTLVTPSPLLGAVRWPSDEAREWAIDLVARAQRGEDVVAVVAYGSAVRERVISSDADLLVIVRRELVLPPAPLDVDLRVVRIQEVEGALANGDEVLGWAARFGVPLMEANAFWSSLAARWIGHLPFPSAEAADERADRAARYEQELRAAGDRDAADEMKLTELTQRARARLLRARVYPLSRPELPGQTRHDRRRRARSPAVSLSAPALGSGCGPAAWFRTHALRAVVNVAGWTQRNYIVQTIQEMNA